MRVILLFIVLFSVQAHGMAPRRPSLSVDKEVAPYYQSFQDLAQTYGASFIADRIVFSFTNFWFSSVVGMCTYRGGSTNYVDFSSSAWRSGSGTFKEMLVFHELGHCLLGRGHTNTSYSDGRKESIMNSYIFSQSTYRAYRDEYLKELFSANVRYTAYSDPYGEVDHDVGGCTFGR
ncbi:MAG: hypothetical protein H6617_00785 [Bdellovibrionaceae bacterium]|nr:hypothetical protein [Bdellovibrionales bacterium]MCB9253202.1 hypothetical protein [Pseudobdellovibrionaceae bacterium]